MKKEKVFFKNSKGDKLCGILCSASAERIVILCHGISYSKNSRKNVALEAMFNDRNIATFRFDFYGHGESRGKFEEVTISEAVDDVRQAIAFCKNRGFSKIGMVGSSFGGMACLLAASKQKDLSAVVLIAPVSDYLGKILSQISHYPVVDWKKKGYIYYQSGDGRKLPLNYSFYEDAERVHGYEAAKEITIPTLIIHGDKDTIVPLEQSKKTATIINGCTLKIIPDAGHDFAKKEDFENLLGLTTEFIEKNFKN